MWAHRQHKTNHKTPNSGHHRRTRSSAPSPLESLSARQAMTAAAIARVVGFAVMVLFIAYYVGALALMGTP